MIELIPFVFNTRLLILVAFVLLFGFLLGRRIRLGIGEGGIIMNQFYMKPIAFRNNNKICEL